MTVQLIEPADIDRVMQGFRGRYFCNETELQNHVANLLSLAGISYLREYRLSNTERVDFFCDGLALEVKFRESATSIRRQLKRYADSPEVRSVLLVCPKAHFMPPTLSGKPVHVIPLWRHMVA